MMQAPLPRNWARELAVDCAAGLGLRVFRAPIVTLPDAVAPVVVSSVVFACAVAMRDAADVGKLAAAVTLTKWTGIACGTGSGAGCRISAREYFPCSP